MDFEEEGFDMEQDFEGQTKEKEQQGEEED